MGSSCLSAYSSVLAAYLEFVPVQLVEGVGHGIAEAVEARVQVRTPLAGRQVAHVLGHGKRTEEEEVKVKQQHHHQHCRRVDDHEAQEHDRKASAYGPLTSSGDPSGSKAMVASSTACTPLTTPPCRAEVKGCVMI